MKMAESFATNTKSCFRSPKPGEEESKLLQGSIPKVNCLQPSEKKVSHVSALLEAETKTV